MPCKLPPNLRSPVGTVLWFAALVWQGSHQTADADECRYSLFSPAPKAQMRELSPDRPDKTESPYTVDAGHYELEMDFANFTDNIAEGTETRTWNIAPFNFKAGLLNNTDLQFVFDDYLYARTKYTATRATQNRSGIGDLTVRLKVNAWGDDSGTAAFAFLPFIKVPTNTAGLGNNALEGGIILPLAVKLPAEFAMGCEAAALLLQNDLDPRYHADILNSITMDHSIFRPLSGYLELFSDISAQPHSSWIGTMDAGLEMAAGSNLQFDCGCNFGISPAADRYNPFAGVTIRF